MQRRQAWYREFIIEEGATPLSFVGSASLRDNPTEVAARMKTALGITPGEVASMKKWSDAFSDLWLRAEQLGVIIICNGVVGNNTNRVLDVAEFRGFVLTDAYAPLVFINNADAKAAQMFTLVHELVHLWIGAAGISNFKEMNPAENETELFCNAVAAEFLVPRDEFRAIWRDEKSFYSLAAHFKVSPLVIARRALDLQCITKSEFFGFYNSYMANVRAQKAEKKAAKDGGGNFYSNCDYRIGRPFAAAIARATSGGRLLFRDAYNLTGLQGATFDKYLQKVNREGG